MKLKEIKEKNWKNNSLGSFTLQVAVALE